MKKETNLERIQREVFSYDTEAGYRLRYHITRALMDKRYAKKINFYCDGATRRISQLFLFVCTSEGQAYWFTIYEGIRGRWLSDTK